MSGRFQLKRLDKLAAPRLYIMEEGQMIPSHISIPQPEGPDIPITTHDVHTASKMLGVHFSPAGNSSVHVENMVQKGLDWVDCLKTKPVIRSDAWLSFYLQLLSTISWGLVTVCIPPKKLDFQYQQIYARALPSLGVNFKIKQEWGTLPEQYQGLGMLNFPLLALAKKLMFLVGNWGLIGQAHSDALSMAYENFLIEVGLYGSPLNWKYDEYGTFSTEATWFQNLWQLVSTFGVEVTFRSADTIKGIQENDSSLMTEFFRIGYRNKQLESLNIVRRYRNLFHLSDISKCDGKSLDTFVLSDMAETSEQYTFPREEPATMDFTLWNEAINLLCSGSIILPRALGAFPVPPHLPMEWHTDSNSSILYYTGGEDTTDSYQVYSPHDHRMTKRFGQKFDWSASVIVHHPGTHYASVLMISDSCAELHSTAPYPVAPIPPVSFKDVLFSHGHIELWEQMSVDGDRE